jgi:pimeloyl-ACP methyl ester carboxylesterase
MDFLFKGFYITGRGVETRELSSGKIYLRIAVAIVLGMAILMLLLLVFKNRLVFYPAREIEITPAATGWEFEDLFIASTGGARINAWYLPGPAEKPPRTVLLLHGNGGNLENMLGRVMTYHKLDYGVLAIDYQGYGRSEGRPSEENTYDDALAAWNFLVKEKGIPPENIVIHGFSLGGGVASYLALEKKEYRNPLILDSTFTKLRDVPAALNVLLSLPARFALGDAYDTESRLGEINSRIVLFFHSPEDDVVPYKLGRRIFEGYQGGPKLFFELRGRHLDYPFNQPVYADAFYSHVMNREPLLLRAPKKDEDGSPAAPDGAAGTLDAPSIP